LSSEEPDVAETVAAVVAGCTERDEVRFGMLALLAPEHRMVYLQVLPASAALTAPAIALQQLQNS
jgi:hypothetical protein